MIYLKEGNTPLNEAWADEIYQEGNSTYQLTFKYPLSSDKWKLLTEETELIADDLHGEQEFTIFEVVKEQGYIIVYANQIATLLKYHSISSINVDRVAGNVVMTALAGAILRDCPFSFYSDITEKHTFNAANISVMDALIKEKHSIVGQWGGDLVRDKYQVSLLKNGGSETEALFMYKKNMRSPQQTTSTKELRTRIHFRKKIEVGEGDNRKEQWLRVTVDSPLISKYKHIYEDDMEVTDEDVKDLASLTKYGEQYYRTTLCDMIEDSLELDVAGIGDVPVKIFDIVSVYHEQFSIDVRKKITKYRYSPMGKRLKSVGFGTIQQTLGGALNAMVSDSVKAETATIEQDFEIKLEKELKNADKVFDQKMNQMEQSLSDEIEQARAKAEEVKAAMTDQLNLKINQSKSEVTEQLKSDFDRKLANAQNELAGVRANLTQAQNQLSGNISQIRSDVGAIRNQQTVYEQSNAQNLARITGQLADKASKTEVKQTADGIREELASLSVGENLFINSEFKNLRDNGQRYTANGKTYQNMIAPYWYNPYNAGLPNAQNNQHGYFDTETFSDTVFAFNESDGSRHWKALSTDFKIGVITAGEYYFSADLYATDLGTHIKFGFYYHNSTGKLNFYAGQTKIEVNEKGRWVRLGAPLKVNDDIDLTKKVQFYIYGYNFASNSILYLKKPKVSKGRLKSDWSPALEDTEGLITEAKAVFERTAQGLRTDLTAVQSYVNSDSTRAEAFRTYSREETARQLTAERKAIEAGYVAKTQHTEDVRSISRRFEELVVGGRNLMGVFNTKPVKSSFDRETYKLTAKTTQNTTRPTLMLQFRWADGSYGAAVTISEVGKFARKFKITKPYSELRVKFNCNKEDAVLLFTGRPFIEQNTDYYFTGDLINLSPNDSQADFLKIEKATITSDWSPAPEDATSYADTKLAEYRQTVDGQFATMSSQIGESLKKTDISITPGQITLGTGKVVNGQTLASLFVQNPESIQAITKLMRITGDLIVDGSITGRDLAAGAITTPHLAAGAVTAEVLGANAVTADKVKADDALLEKLTAGEALLRKLMAKDAFINRLQSIDFTAEQVKGGMIKALNGALKIDLNNGQYNVMTDQAAIRRVINGYPNQFLKFTSETEGGAPASVTVLGANRDGTENSKNDSFAGIRLYSGNKVERTEIISDVVRFATGAVNYRGWEMRTLYGNDNRQVILQPFGNVTRSNIVANYFNGIDLVNVLETLNQMMANLGNHTGRHDIFGPIRGLGARKYAR